MAKTHGFACKATAATLSALLVCALFGLPAAAYADELEEAQAAVDDAQSVLDSAEERMGQIAVEYDEASSEVDRLQGEIDELAEKVMAAQQAMLEGRASLGQAAAYEYRNNVLSTLFSVVFESSSLDELLRNIEYVNQIMEHHAAEVEQQKELKTQFEEASTKLSAQKDEQDRVLAELEQKRAEAEQVVSDASVKLAGAEADQAARLEALREQAAQFEREVAQGGADIAENANTVDRADVIPAGTPVAPNPDDNAGNAGAGGAGSSSDAGNGSGGLGGSGNGEDGPGSSTAGWMVGVASAYGGSSDPYTPNPGTTATGAVCDDYSMGVAVPMSLPNYRSYFGRTVEISYNGMTVYAVVNDCGYMGGGSRALDLQPGVFKAFGYSNCYAWGLRTVSYRFL